MGILFYSFLILRRNRHKLYISPKLKRRYGDHTITAPSLLHHFAIPTWHLRNAFRSLRVSVLLLVPLCTRRRHHCTITVPSLCRRELSEMARKLFLCSLIIYVQPGTIMQVIGATAIASIFTCAHIKCQPFEEDLDDNLQSCSLVSTVFTLWAAALLMSPETAC